MAVRVLNTQMVGEAFYFHPHTPFRHLARCEYCQKWICESCGGSSIWNEEIGDYEWMCDHCFFVTDSHPSSRV